jgi:hypothetical protein
MGIGDEISFSSAHDAREERDLRANFHALVKTLREPDWERIDSEALTKLRTTYAQLRERGVSIHELLTSARQYKITEEKMRDLLGLNRDR